jgi:hypothetical protein
LNICIGDAWVAFEFILFCELMALHIVLVCVAFECGVVYIVVMSKVKTEGRALVSKGKLTPDGVAFKHGGENFHGERGFASKFKTVADALEWMFHDDRHIVGYAIVHSDKELLNMINDIVPKEFRISEKTWKRYKDGEISRSELDEDVERFRRAYERAVMRQKERLFELMAEDVAGGWQRWTWIIERRFDEWNLRSKIVEETIEPKQLVFRVVKEEES